MTSMFFFFFNDTATTEIYTLSLHDALPIWVRPSGLKATLVTPCACPASGEPRGSRRARSHVTTVPSPPPDARIFPSGLKATLLTPCLGPASTAARGSRAAASHRMIQPSAPPQATGLPSGAKAIALTPDLC